MIHLSHALLIVLITGTCCAFEAAACELADTSWRLVRIMSMDDRVDVPDDRAKYTLELQADGTATMQADCNRGSGSWISEATGQLRFGPVASTHALCPPGSLSEKYLAQFEWVRSYVMKNGHLFLATMADGSIIEFEPAGDSALAANARGEEIRRTDAAEIGAFVEDTRRKMGRAMVRQWKISKARYDGCGGRIIYQQLVRQPLDAYRRFLEQRQAESAFRNHDHAPGGPVLALLRR